MEDFTAGKIERRAKERPWKKRFFFIGDL